MTGLKRALWRGMVKGVILCALVTWMTAGWLMFGPDAVMVSQP